MNPSIPDLVTEMFMVYINFALDKNLISRLVSLFLLLDYLEKQSMPFVGPQTFSTFNNPQGRAGSMNLSAIGRGGKGHQHRDSAFFSAQ